MWVGDGDKYLSIYIYTEDGSNSFLRNVGNHQRDHNIEEKGTSPLPRRKEMGNARSPREAEAQFAECGSQFYSGLFVHEADVVLLQAILNLGT